MDWKKFQKTPKDIEPHGLSLEHQEIGFQICMVCWAFAKFALVGRGFLHDLRTVWFVR